MRILIKIPTRERHKKIKPLIESLKAFANRPELLTFLITLDLDDDSIGANYEDAFFNDCHLDIGSSKNKIEAFNSGISSILGWDILLCLNDDMIVIVKGWDDIIRNFMPEDLDSSLWLPDGIQSRINCIECIGYNYYKRFGYIYNPIYKSFYSDNESTLIAQLLGRQIKVPANLFLHNHPEITKIKDDLFIRNQRAWNEDKATWELRKKEIYKKYGAL